MLVVLELQVHEWTCCEVEDETGLVRRVHEVPYINSVCFCDENDTRTGWREGTTCIMSSLGVHRLEDRLLITFKIYLPDSKMEIMNSQEKIWIERRSFKCKARPVFFLTIISEFHVFSNLRRIIRCLNRLHTPINEYKVAFI